MILFSGALLYPLTAIFAPIGHWDWNGATPGSTQSAIVVSLALTAAALAIVVIVGTPAAWHLARSDGRERLIWDAVILISVLMPPLALGILLSIAFGTPTRFGRALLRIGVPTSNSATAFIATQVYVSIGYYVVAARAAFAAVPHRLEQIGALLGSSPWRVFWRVTFPLSRLGLAVALSLAWVRALGEFGAIVITAYYPAGMPVQIWTNLQDAGLPAVMPLLLIFILTALPLPWLIHLMAHRMPDA
jgi:molybdate/tungstate transport system permease protein